MAIMRLELLLSAVLLFILLLGSHVSCAKVSHSAFMSITGANRREILQEDNPVSRIGTRVLTKTMPRLNLEEISLEFNSSMEAEMLLQFRNEITTDPHDFLSGWTSGNSSNYCSWTGVLCSSSIGPVSALNLSGQQLAGFISPSLGGLQFLSSLNLSSNNFTGVIPTSISNCSFLTVLDLSMNMLGSTIPPELRSLSNLEELHLGQNALTGVFPSFLANFSTLRVLDLGANEISGDIMSLYWGNSGQLETLILHANAISGFVPDSLSNCSALVYIDISNNELIGNITVPFEKLQNLKYLDVSQNSLTGQIPPTFGVLPSLHILYLWGNVLTGPIPTSLGDCKSLTDLEVSDNLLSGEIPEQLGNLKNLTTLYLNNNSLVGPIPAAFSNCSALTGLYLYENQLSGNIPAELGMLSQLHDIFLWGNKLTGIIPATLANCSSLSSIVLSENLLSGEIPWALGTLTELQFLYLHLNKFVGSIPASLGNCSTLQTLLLDGNLLSGEIPGQLGLLQNLSKLDVGNNFLIGSIPSTLGNSTALLSLSLANNQLIGSIPTSIGGLANLQGLNLSHNQLTGDIPADLFQCRELSVLDLSSNSLSGNIPTNLALLESMNELYLNSNNLTGSISSVVNLRSINLLGLSVAHNQLTGVISAYNFSPLRNLRLSFDLSYNLLSGPLPSGIGALNSVQNIDLSFNAFSGVIIDALSLCMGLESLDLSSNNLEGEIPQSLTALQQLTYFNVSFNELTGPVPDTGQFANFTAGSFLGNSDLCGPMLPKNCNTASGQHGSKKSCHGGFCHPLWILIIPVVAASIASGLIVTAIWFLFIAKTTDHTAAVAPALPPVSHFTSEFQDLSFGGIVAATNGFSDSNIMGVGTKSTVFAGILPGGLMIAVKRLQLRNDDKATVQLYRELQRLSALEHPNLLKVHGLFSTGDAKVLVLEYMANGSLQKQLYEGESCCLTWAERLDIALGVAEAMVHLHHSGTKPVLHLDLKPSNILLNSDMEPKVADYGVNRFLNHENRGDFSVSSNLYGTIGYIPPEYGAMTSVSTMGDVYNYGVVLMELITRKQPTDDMFGQEMSLRSWVVEAFPGRISHILDSTLRQELARNELELGIHLLVRLAVACTQNSPKDRPTMIEARDMLMEIKSIDHPCKTY